MANDADKQLQHLLRELAPQVLGVVMRRYRDLPNAEDAVQEALLTAATKWPSEGHPDNPRGWLIQVACRRITDHVRADAARRHREKLVVSLVTFDDQIALAADAPEPSDDTLDLLFMCCHPALSPASAVALTLRAVGGLTTFEIAKAYLVPEATLAQRISRAKQTIKTSGIAFGLPEPTERAARLTSVMHVLYLIFNEGYTASSGESLQRTDLSVEAIRLTRLLHRLAPQEAEVAGLLALMLLTDARRAARSGSDGELIPLDAQDRRRWDQAAISEGIGLIEDPVPPEQIGPYRVQAAIAAVHDRAPSAAETAWSEILALYTLLLRMSDNPIVALNHAVALAMVDGPQAGLDRLDDLASDPRLAEHHRLDAVRAHLLERNGQPAQAIPFYRRAAERTASSTERDYLRLQAARLDQAVQQK